MNTASDIESALHQATSDVFSQAEKHRLTILASLPSTDVRGDNISFLLRRIDDRIALAAGYEESAVRAKAEGADLDHIIALRREAKAIRAQAEAQANTLRTLFSL